jgi:hypothetical protein
MLFVLKIKLFIFLPHLIKTERIKELFIDIYSNFCDICTDHQDRELQLRFVSSLGRSDNDFLSIATRNFIASFVQMNKLLIVWTNTRKISKWNFVEIFLVKYARNKYFKCFCPQFI